MGFNITTFEAAPTANPMLDDVRGLVAAQDAATDQLAGELTVTADEAEKVKLQIQAAARQLDRSARVKVTPKGKNATLTVLIKPRRTRTPKGDK